MPMAAGVFGVKQGEEETGSFHHSRRIEPRDGRLEELGQIESEERAEI